MTAVMTPDDLSVDDAELEAEALAAHARRRGRRRRRQLVGRRRAHRPRPAPELVHAHRRGRRPAADRLEAASSPGPLILMFLAINAAGLCSTYGRVLPANL